MPTMRDDVRRGLSDIWPAAVAAAPIGLLFGAVAASKGLSPLEVFLMSATVFAGGAQFAAVELWSTPAPIAALIFSTFLINARHVLMGASLAPKLTGFSRWQTLLGLYYMADENWALAEKRARTHRLTPAYWFAMVVPFVTGWLGTSTLGAMIGAVLGDPKRLGADFAFTALFIALVAAFWKGRVTFWTVAAAGIASAVTYRLAGPPWHVAAGALSGLLAAWIAAGKAKP
ncbi:AzlC family ABC transporter permease [Bosea sp. (in: a-proteobacteria)]|uniref:AzlC family ABC transporter permease n=1 Tax=Bosea sp. (in: a-proteobacteria) TaxID=1871050 RepID=UPI00260F2490|nr:AzlC family ABC transporter permease [Bosea sp. (in: a-proteobacteria)]MCO5091918.1 AzlC family ABC transporter permease [Bosea sp. (in: a-proteobacteria)]